MSGASNAPFIVPNVPTLAEQRLARLAEADPFIRVMIGIIRPMLPATRQVLVERCADDPLLTADAKRLTTLLVGVFNESEAAA